MKKLLIAGFLLITGTLFSQKYYFGAQINTLLGISAYSLQACPGPAVGIDYQVADNWEVRFQTQVGAFFGYDFLFKFDAAYILTFGQIEMGAGIGSALVFGSAILHTTDTNYSFPGFPQLGLGVRLMPLRIDFGTLRISFLDTFIGTDMLKFGSVLMVDTDIFSVSVPLN